MSLWEAVGLFVAWRVFAFAFDAFAEWWLGYRRETPDQ